MWSTSDSLADKVEHTVATPQNCSVILLTGESYLQQTHSGGLSTLCLDAKSMDTTRFSLLILLYLIFLYKRYYTTLIGVTGRCHTGA